MHCVQYTQGTLACVKIHTCLVRDYFVVKTEQLLDEVSVGFLLKQNVNKACYPRRFKMTKEPFHVLKEGRLRLSTALLCFLSFKVKKVSLNKA